MVTNKKNWSDLSKFISVILTIFVFVVLIIILKNSIIHIINVLKFRWEISDGEGLLANNIEFLRSGKSIYTDINKWPFIANPYPPFFSFTSYIFSILIPKNPLLSIRLLSILSTLGLSILIYFMLLKREISKKISCITSILFLITPLMLMWGYLGRVDVLGAVLSMLAVFLVLNSDKKLNIILAATICVLAFYTKPTFLAAPAAIFFYLLINRKYLKTILFTGIIIFVGVIVFLILNKWTNGQFYQNVFHNNLSSYHIKPFLSYSRDFIFFYWFFIVGSIIFFVKSLRKKKLPLLFFYLIFSFLLTLTSGREGASTNYYIELLAVTMICGTIGFFSLNKPDKSKNYEIIFLILILLQICSLTLYQKSYLKRVYVTKEFNFNPSKQDVEKINTLEKKVDENCSNSIFSDDTNFSIHQNTEPFGIPTTLYIIFSGNNSFDNKSQFVEQFSSGKTKCVILGKGWVIDEALNEINSEYTLIYSADTSLWDYRLYKFKE